MSNSSKSKQVARALESFLVKNQDASLSTFKADLKQLEHRLIDEGSTEWQSLEIRRRCAEMYCSQCFAERTDWATVQHSLKTLDSLGYSNCERSAHFAVLLLNYSSRNAEAASDARSRAAAALRKIRYLKRRSHLRTHMEPLLAEGN